jgi:TetR/AcrR family transcriptional repressor of nem operon
MSTKADNTKTRILDAAQDLILSRGFAGTSVDAIQDAAAISRGTFFYHFPSKSDLAEALLVRYASNDEGMINSFMARAEKLSSDPLQQSLIFLALYEELFEETALGDAGCLFASYSYEAGLFDENAHRILVEALAHWREVLGGKLAEAMERHPTRGETSDPYLLADLAHGAMQGAFILGRVQSDPALMIQHIQQFRRFLELLFGIEKGATST